LDYNDWFNIMGDEVGFVEGTIGGSVLGGKDVKRWKAAGDIRGIPSSRCAINQLRVFLSKK